METAPHSARSPLYIKIWGVLLMLTVAEIVCTQLSLGRSTMLGALVLLATVKATLVAVYFMHLRWERVLLAGVALLPFPLATLFAVVLMLENAR